MRFLVLGKLIRKPRRAITISSPLHDEAYSGRLDRVNTRLLNSIDNDEELEFTVDHFADSDDETFPYEMEMNRDSPTLGLTPLAQGTNQPSTSTEVKDSASMELLRFSTRRTKEDRTGCLSGPLTQLTSLGKILA